MPWLERCVVSVALLLGMAAVARAQEEPLVVWVVGPERPKTNLEAINELHHATPLTYKEQDAGTFGQTSSTFGQTSGSYGQPSDTATISTPQAAPGADAPAGTPNGLGYQQQTSGSFGQTASTYGTDASNHGQESSTYGQTASSYGTAASNHGVDAGSFHGAAPVAGETQPIQSALRDAFATLMHEMFPEVHVRYLVVPGNELRADLQAASGTNLYPDLIVGDVPASWAADARRQYLVASIVPAVMVADGVSGAGETTPGMLPVTIALRARHRELAELVVTRLNEMGAGAAASVTASEKAAVAVATGAVSLLVRGQSMGNLVDPEMAAFSAQLGPQMLLTSAKQLADGAASKMEVARTSVNGQLAVVVLRVVASTNRVFGVAHPLVVLRRSGAGPWRVLHVSLNLPAFDAERERVALMQTTPDATAERKGGVSGVVLSAPLNGDTRSAMPVLGWDNKGGAGLQVVEWQRAYAGGWSDARLYLVPDDAAKLKTQTTAEFANAVGSYRWRVWSVGAEGAMKISGWRTFNVAQ
jgi:hypothetical protein